MGITRNLEATPAVEKDVLARPSPRANLKHHSSLTDSVRERLLLKIHLGTESEGGGPPHFHIGGQM